MGREFGPIVRQIDQVMINNWANVIGDYNPIHVDEEYAKTTQFGGTIAHGTLLIAFVDELMIREFGEKWLLEPHWHFSARLKKPVRPGDTIKVQGFEDDYGNYKIDWFNQKGVLLITAKITGFNP